MENDSKLVLALKAARAMIENEAHWAQGEAAVDLYGYPTHATSETAHRRCLGSAVVCAVSRIERGSRERNVLRANVNAAIVHAPSFPTWMNDEDDCPVIRANDWKSTTHRDVLSWIDEAIHTHGGTE